MRVKTASTEHRILFLMRSASQLYSEARGKLIIILVLSGVCAAAAQTLPEIARVNSVKSLTKILSLVEKDNGDKARFTTMKLQTYLEDVYISQGTTILLKPRELSKAIGELLAEGESRAAVAKAILKRYKDGEFHEK